MEKQKQLSEETEQLRKQLNDAEMQLGNIRNRAEHAPGEESEGGKAKSDDCPEREARATL